jgi:hypothetical protein
MSEIILNKLLESGVSFQLEDHGKIDFRLNASLRDKNIARGDGYTLNFKIGDASGELCLSFDSFSKSLVESSKNLLLDHLSILGDLKVEGHFFLEIDGKKNKIDNGLPPELMSATSFKIIFESAMYDLRKEKELAILEKSLGEVGLLIVLILLPYELEAFGEVEGQKTEVLITKHERSRKNRMLCLAHFGYKCQVCKFDFGESYGETARDFIHVHHIERVSDSGPTVVNPIKDLVPLCPNCHAVAHLKTPPYLPEEIREFRKRVKDEPV